MRLRNVTVKPHAECKAYMLRAIYSSKLHIILHTVGSIKRTPPGVGKHPYLQYVAVFKLFPAKLCFFVEVKCSVIAPCTPIEAHTLPTCG